MFLRDTSDWWPNESNHLNEPPKRADSLKRIILTHHDNFHIFYAAINVEQ